MTMGLKNVEYGLNILEIMDTGPFFPLFTKCHGTLARVVSHANQIRYEE